jgi:outer membrane protein assembly factor BamB
VRPLSRSATVLAVALALVGCTQAAETSGATVPVRSADRAVAASTSIAPWPQYHHGAQRLGRLSSAPGTLTPGWTRKLDGAVYGEPLVVGGLLVVATEADGVYGLRPRTGAVVWHKSLGTPQPLSGLPCGDIDPLGVTSTPAYDPRTGSVFVAAETLGGHHTLWALNPTTGAKRWHRTLDTLPGRTIKAEQQRGALMVAGGRVVTVVGGLYGDCGNYVGYATSMRTDGTGSTRTYAVPTAREGGIWATPGAVAGPDGSVLVASGNGASTSGAWDGSDSVIQLDSGTLRRRSAFAPSSWREDNASDADLGSSAPARVHAVHRIVIGGKGGVYLLRTPFGGVGSSIASLSGCAAFGGTAVAGSTVLMPCLRSDEIRALHVGPSSLSWGWSSPNLFGAPVIAGANVYVADRGSGDLVVLSLSTGQVQQRLHAGNLTHFPSEVVSGDWVFVPTLDGVTSFHG